MKKRTGLRKCLSLLSVGLVLLLSGRHSGFAQGKNTPQAYRQAGDDHWKTQEYYEAGQQYEQVLATDPTNQEVTYRLAECYRFTFDYDAALQQYALLSQADATHQYPLARYYAALMTKRTDQFAEAIRLFDQFEAYTRSLVGETRQVTEAFSEKALLEKAGCQVALHETPLNLAYFAKFKLDELSPIHRQKAHKIIRRKESGRIHMEDMPLFGEDAFFFSVRLNAQQQTKVSKIMAQGLDTLTETQIAEIRQLDQKYYEGLLEEDRDRIDRFAGAYRMAVDANERVMLDETDDFYYASLPAESKDQFDRAVAYRMHEATRSQLARLKQRKRMEEMDKNEISHRRAEEPIQITSEALAGLQAEDQKYYLGLPERDKAQFDRIAEARRLSKGTGGAFVLEQEDRTYYDKLSEEDKKRLDRQASVLATRRSNPAPASQLGEDQQLYNGLPEEDKLRIDRILEARWLAKKSTGGLALNEGDQAYFDKLTEAQKQQLDRLADRALPKEKTSELPTAPKDSQALATLPEEGRNRIDRILAAKILAHRTGKEPVLNAADQAYFDKLSETEKNRLDQKARQMALLKTSAQSQDPATEAEQYWRNLPESEQNQVARIAEAQRSAKQTGQPLRLNPQDRAYYDKLSEIEKDLLERVNKRPNYTTAEAALAQLAEDEQYYAGLPEEEKLRIERILQAKALARHRKEEARLNAPDQAYYDKLSEMEKDRLDRLASARRLPADLPAMADDNTPVASSGKPTGTKKPASQSTKGQQAEKRTVTSHPEAAVAEPATSLTKPEWLFFDSDQIRLRTEARKALNDLALFCQQFPAARLELHAFADDRGDARYNWTLSQKRGEGIAAYLIGKGIKPVQIRVKPEGELAMPASGESAYTRQVNRRVEIRVKNGPLHYSWETQTCILHAPATVKELAEAFGISISELRELNGDLPDRIEAYQPIRVKRATTPFPNSFLSDPKATLTLQR